MQFYSYILYSQKLDKYYIGNTDNLEKRLIRHNLGHTAYTKTGIPWELYYFEEYKTRSEAFRREMEIKSKKSRIYIEQLKKTKHYGS